MTTTQMYWLVILDNFGYLFVTLIGATLAWVALNAIRWVNAATEDKPCPPHVQDHIFRGIVFVCGVAFIAAFVPTTKQMAAILVVPKIVNCEAVQTVGNELYTLALDWMKELRPKKEKK